MEGGDELLEKIIEFMVSSIFAILIFAVLAEAIAFMITFIGFPGMVVLAIVGILWADHKRKGN